MKLQRTAAHASPAMAATKGKPAPSAAKKVAGAPAKKMRAHNGEDRLEMIRQQAYFLFTSRNGATDPTSTIGFGQRPWWTSS